MADLEKEMREKLLDNQNNINDIYTLFSDFNNEYSILERKATILQNDIDRINKLSNKIEEMNKKIRSYIYDENVLDELRNIHVQVYNKMGVLNTRQSLNKKRDSNCIDETENINKLPILKKLSFTLGEKIYLENENDQIYHSLEGSDRSYHQFAIPKCESIIMEQTATSTEAPNPQINDNNTYMNINFVIFTVLMVCLFVVLVFYVYWI